jgi:hypothetical protein
MRAVVETSEAGHYTINLTGESLVLPPGVQVTCRPTTIPATAAKVLDRTEYVSFPGLPAALITAFFVFDLSLTHADEQLHFVLALPLEGVPTDREQRILQTVLASPALVARMLLFLLRSERHPDIGEIFSILETPITSPGLPTSDATNAFSGLPLFEAMTRTLGEQPERLEHVRTLIEALRNNDALENRLLPTGFDEIWTPIWEAYMRICHAHTD